IIKYSHMSRANFCRVFKKETGNTFLQYLNNLRIAYAHSLLTETNMPIQRISEKSGFSSVLHFDRVFKNIHGITPSAMRKNR
ncbi:MAG: helix-turn-helix domain-containing protein, partial [Eubacterium sp.]